MKLRFWLKRGICIFVVVLGILFGVELLKGHALEEAIYFALTWAGVSTSIFLTTRLYYVRKGTACSMCDDIPDEGSSKKVEAFLYPESNKPKD